MATKLFLGGISPATSTEVIADHFSQFGTVMDAVAMVTRDGKHRGFGFVTFDSEEAAELVLGQEQVIDGRVIDIKRADGQGGPHGAAAEPPVGGPFAGGVAPRPTSAFMAPVGGNPGWQGGLSPLAFDFQQPFIGAAPSRYSAPSASPRQGGMGGGGGGALDSPNKVFVGGLSRETTDDTLRDYFSQFGVLTDCVVMKEKETNKPRGFGFVAFETADSVDLVMEAYESHQIDGKWVEVKRATARDAAPGPSGGQRMFMGMPPRQAMGGKGGFAAKPSFSMALPAPGPGGCGGGGGSNGSANKVFIGGLSSDTTDESLREHFQQYGVLVDCVAMKDKMTNKPRGFGFVQYDDPGSVEAVMQDYASHRVDGKWVEVKRAAAREAMSMSMAPIGRGGGCGYGPALPMRTFRAGPYGR